MPPLPLDSRRRTRGRGGCWSKSALTSSQTWPSLSCIHFSDNALWSSLVKRCLRNFGAPVRRRLSVVLPCSGQLGLNWPGSGGTPPAPPLLAKSRLTVNNTDPPNKSNPGSAAEVRPSFADTGQFRAKFARVRRHLPEFGPPMHGRHSALAPRNFPTLQEYLQSRPGGEYFSTRFRSIPHHLRNPL